MSTPSVYILAIGNELLNGSVADTNTAFIADELRRLGLAVCGATLVGDQAEDIKDGLRWAAGRSSLIITTGGLGPTTDDLTRNAIADLLGVELVEDASALAKLTELMARRGRALNENNLRQVYFPRGAHVIPNPIGTADAFMVDLPAAAGHAVPVLSLPGVPAEVKKLFEAELRVRLSQKFPGLSPLRAAALRCFGLSEAHLGGCVERCSLPDGIEVAYRPSFPEITLWLEDRGGFDTEASAKRLEDAAGCIIAGIGQQFVFTRSPHHTMAHAVGELLEARGLMMAAAESCSGGMLASQLISRPGSSAYFAGGIVSYSNSAKQTFLGVKRNVIDVHGAVSRPVALAMARGAQARTGADYAVSVTGIAGPDGGSADKPVGTVWIGLSTPEEEFAVKHFLPWGRNQIRSYATTLALDLVRRHILKYPLEWEKQ